MSRVLLVGGDLMAKSRLVDATSRAGIALESTSVAGLSDHLREGQPMLVVLDLDEGGDAALAALSASRASGLGLPRVVGYFSHVNRELGQAAEAAGCEAWPRGKFWSSLPQLLQPEG